MSMRHPDQLHMGDFAWTDLKLLVYSQDDAFRFLARQTFRKLGVRDIFSTSLATDATPLMARKPDAALIDLDESEALGFLERLRKEDTAMPVMVVAKPSDRDLLDKCATLGIEGFIPKPVSGHEMSLRVAKTIKNPRRLPAPSAPPPKPAIKLTPPPGRMAVDPGKPLVGTGAEIPPAPPNPQAAEQMAQLSALTQRLGASLGLSSGPAPSGSGFDGISPPPLPGKISGGKLDMGDMPLAQPKPSQSIDMTDAPKADAGAKSQPFKPSGGFDMSDAPKTQKISGGKLDLDEPPQKTKRQKLAELLPEGLRPVDDAEARRKAEKARADWLAELEKSGRKPKKGKDVPSLNLDGIIGAHVLWLSTQGAEGARAQFASMDLGGADLADAVLANANFRQADLSDARMTNARLDGSDFRHGVLEAADMAGANLSVAQLRHANLKLSNLEGASLRGADLSGAALKGAKLRGADFKGATLVGTDLTEADLSGVENMTQSQIDKSHCVASTRLPPGLSRPDRGEQA